MAVLERPSRVELRIPLGKNFTLLFVTFSPAILCCFTCVTTCFVVSCSYVVILCHCFDTHVFSELSPPGTCFSVVVKRIWSRRRLSVSSLRARAAARLTFRVTPRVHQGMFHWQTTQNQNPQQRFSLASSSHPQQPFNPVFTQDQEDYPPAQEGGSPTSQDQEFFTGEQNPALSPYHTRAHGYSAPTSSPLQEERALPPSFSQRNQGSTFHPFYSTFYPPQY